MDNIEARIGELTGILNRYDPELLDDMTEALRIGGDTDLLAAKAMEKQSAAFQLLVLLDRVKARQRDNRDTVTGATQ